VAVLALDLELAGMNVVPEEHRLAGTLQRTGIGDGGSSDRIGGRLGLLCMSRRVAERKQGCESAGPDAAEHECQRTHDPSHT
jgi:hypothetical protein